jgi:CubicO group peptidase (beta-lactamase class C family)
MKLNLKRIVSYGLPVFVLIVSCYSPSIISTDYSPTEGWRTSTPEKQGIDSGELIEMMIIIQKMEAHFDSITIVRNGYLVTDAYFYPFEKGLKHIIHSCTKSITSALIGIAIDKGYIKSIDQPVIEFFPDKSFNNLDGNKRNMTVKHLLMMAPGIKCRDSYKYRWVGLEQMKSSDDWVQFFLDLPMSEAPGERFEYCNGASFILGAIIQKVTEMKLRDFADQYLFAPLGITDVSWKENPQGINIGFSRIWLNPHDMAKFGLLFLNKGHWNGKQVVSESWVDLSTQGHIKQDLFDQYGFQWHLDNAGYYMAVGYGGQYIFVIPNKNMVVVFTGIHLKSGFFYANTLLKNWIIPAATSSVPLPKNSDKNQQLSSMLNEMASSNPAKPVPSLPELAIKITGKTYNLEENVLGLKSLTFNFYKIGDLMYIDRHEIGDKVYPLIVGLDDVYRITRSDRGRVASKGTWIRKDTFMIYMHHVGYTTKPVTTMVFKDDKVLVEIKGQISGWPDISLKGVYSKE